MANKFSLPALMRRIVLALFFLSAHVGTAMLVLRFMSGNGVVAAFWPPSGIALAGLLLGGLRYAPLVFVAASFVNWLIGGPWYVAIFLGAVNLAEALLGYWLLRVARPIQPQLNRARDFFRLFLYAGFISPIPSAVLGALTLKLAGLTEQSWVQNFQFWWMGDSLGIIVVAPLMLIWQRLDKIDLRRVQIVEGIVAFALAFFTGQMVFVGWLQTYLGFHPRAFVMFIFVTWAAVRFGRHATLVVLCLVIAQILFGQAQGTGHFLQYDRHMQLFNTWLYIAVLSASGMALATFINERKRSLEKLSRVTENLEQISATAHVGGWELDTASMEFSFSAEALRIIDAAPGRKIDMAEAMEFVAVEDRAATEERVFTAIANRTPWDAEFGMVTTKGRPIWVRSQGKAIVENERVVKLIGTVHDLTYRKQTDRALRDSEDRYRRLVESSTDAILVHQGGLIVYANPAAVKILRAQSGKDLIHLSVTKIVPMEYRAMILDRGALVADHGDASGLVEGKFFCFDGSEIDVEISAVETLFNNHASTMIVARDISERKRAEEQIRYLGQHDILTGLPNRALFADRLSQAITFAGTHRNTFSLLFLDVDHFKKINDSLGHHVGDKFLKEITDRLLGCVKSIDTVSRQGGDEFLILLNELTHPEEAALVAQKICAAVAEPVDVGNSRINTSVSIGIAVFPRDGDTPDALIKNADIAMYHAKDSGRNQFQYFSEELNRITRENLELETALRDAVSLGQLEVYYQPQLDLRTGAICSCEALLRWKHPRWGMVSPARFIPLAEESGQIFAIGRWVLASVAERYADLSSAGYAEMRISVNVSAPELQSPSFAADMERTLLQYGMPAENLELEVTESLIMDDAASAGAAIRYLSDLGVRFSIDDFGTGYSSFSYLRQLRIHNLKIDQSFVREILNDANDAVIVQAIIGLAKNLKLQVIAEGVENIQQKDFLRENGCDLMQGFELSGALPFPEFLQLLKKHQASRV